MPNGYTLNPEVFDPAIDLQLEPPEFFKNLMFQKVAFSPESKLSSNGGPSPAAPALDFAYTPPFRVLSSAGVRKLRAAVDRERAHAKSNERIPLVLRGLAYCSQALRDFTYLPAVNELCSQLAGEPLGPHAISMNMGHTNIGMPNPAAEYVDQWHTDSVDYVLIVILSELTEMRGGELQVLQCPDATGEVFARFKREGVPPELVETVPYLEAGYAIFMQGSRILHRVKGVLEAREPRLSMVTSFSRLNVFAHDSTRYHTFSHQDPAHIHPLEFARHKAWRIEGQMRYILDQAPFSSDPQQLASVMRRASAELLHTARLLARETDDPLGFFHERDEQNASDLNRDANPVEASAEGSKGVDVALD